MLRYNFSMSEVSNSSSKKLNIYVKKSVNALPKVVGFLRVLQFSTTGDVGRVGWD